MKKTKLPSKILAVLLAVLMVLPTVAEALPFVGGLFTVEASEVTDTRQHIQIASSNGEDWGNFYQDDYSIRSYPTQDGANIIVPNDEEIRVLQVADLQMSGPITEDCISAIRQGIARVKPHLIVLTGDNAMYCGSSTYKMYEWENTLANIVSYFYDENGDKIPFAVTFGNHDIDSNVTTDESDVYQASKEITYQYNFCVMALGAIDYDYDNDNAVVIDANGISHTVASIIGGSSSIGINDVGSGCVNVYGTDGTTVKQKVLVLNSAVDEGDSGYGKLGYDQDGDIDEYTYSLLCDVLAWEVSQNVPTIAFQHIPLREFYTAEGILKLDSSGIAAYSVDSTLVTSNGTAVSGSSFSPADGTTGIYNETCCCSYSTTELQYRVLANHATDATYTITSSDTYNTGDMTGKTVELKAHNNVVGIFYGHDHSNTLTGTGTVTYDGVGYTLTQGYGGGMDRNHGTEIAYISGYTIGGTGANPTLQKDTWSVESILDDYNTTFGAKYSYSGVTGQNYVNNYTLGKRNYSLTLSSDTAAEYEQEAKDNAVANAGEGATLLEYLSNDDDVGADLNYGFEYGAWIYSAYTNTTDINDAYTDIVLYHGTNPPATLTKEKYGTVITYNLLSDINVNQGSTKESSTAAYLYGTKDAAAGIPITELGISSLSIMYTDSGKRMALTGGWYGTAEYSTDNSFQDRADFNVSMGDTTPSIFLQFKTIGSADPNITATQTSAYDITCQYYDLAEAYTTYAGKNDSYNYESESWADFVEARADAKALKEKLDANRFVTDETKESIEDVTEALYTAYENLDEKEYTASKDQAISQGSVATGAKIAVPETIYLTPSTGSATTAECYLNNTINSDGDVVADANTAATGNIIVNLDEADAATHLKITASRYDTSYAKKAATGWLTVNDKTASSSGDVVIYNDDINGETNNTVNISSLTLGSNGLASAGTCLVEWKIEVTKTVDDIDGGDTDSVYARETVVLTYYAYSVVYAPFNKSVGASLELLLATDTSAIMWSTAWISGIDGITESDGYQWTGDNSGTRDRKNYKLFSEPLYNEAAMEVTANAVWNGQQTATRSTDDDNVDYAFDYVSGGEVWGWLQGNRRGTLHIDTSRYTEYKYLPNFKLGVDYHKVNAELENNNEVYAGYEISTADNGTWYGDEGDYPNPNTIPNQFVANTNSKLSGLSSGQREQTTIADTIDIDSTKTHLSVISGTIVKANREFKLFSHNAADFWLRGTNTVYCDITYTSKAALRKSIGAAVNEGLQEKWDTASTFSAYKTALMAECLNLGTPTNTATAVSTDFTTKQTACRTAQLPEGTVNSYNKTIAQVINPADGTTSGYIVTDKDITSLGYITTATVTKGQYFVTQGTDIPGYTYAGTQQATALAVGSSQTLDANGIITGLKTTKTELKSEYMNSTTANLNGYSYYIGPTVTQTIDMDGGTIGNGYTSVTGSYGSTLTGSASTCTKTGYTFAGWEVISGDGTVSADGMTYTFGNEDGEVKALWKGNAQNVVIDANGGVYNGNILYLTDGQDSATSKFGTTNGTITATKESDDTISITANSTETGNYYSNSNFVYAYLQAGKSYTLSYKCNVASGDAVYFYILGTENKSVKPGEATEYTDSLVIKNRAGTTVTDNGDGTYTRTLNFTVGADDTENNETNWDRLENTADATMVYFFRLDYNNCGTNKIEISDMTVVPTSACDVNIKAASGSTLQINDATYGGHEFLNWTVSGDDAVLTGDDLTVGTATTTLTANWKQAVIIYDVNHDDIQPNIYPIYEADTNDNGIYYSYNKASGEISLWGSNDTISGDTVFELPLTEFLPSQGTYIFTLTRTSGSFSGYKDNCLVFDLCTASGASPSTGRMNNDFAQHRFESSDTVSWSFTLTEAQAKEIGSIKFRIYANGAGINFGTSADPFKFTIKVEQGTTATAYSPSARYANTTGTYSTDLITLADLTGKQFAGWATTPTGTDTEGNSTVVAATDALNGSQTLYAQWDAAKYNVIYNGNGATSGSTTASVHYFDEAKALTANGFVREYTVTYDANGGNALAKTSDTATYTFENWNTKVEGDGTSYGDGQTVTNLTSTDGANVNLFAQWNSASVELPTASKNNTETKHYTFAGWYDAAEGGNKLADATDTTYTPTANKTLYAQYTEADHTWNAGEPTTQATCTTAGVMTYTCTVCGQTKTETIDALGHNFTEEVEGTKTPSTCATQGTVTCKCSRCDATSVVTLELDGNKHNWDGVTWTQTYANDDVTATKKHTASCANGCGTTQSLDCEFEGVVTTDSTCMEKGWTTYTCKVCGGNYKVQNVAKKAHTEVADAAVAATCTTAGKTAGSHCSVCNTVIVAQKTVDALGHSFTTYVSNNDATCTADGTKTAKCDRCDATDTVADTGSALGHSFTTYVSDGNATCTADGTKTAKCDRCTVTDTVADAGSALGHSFTNYVSDGNATCTVDGTKTAKCDRCDVTDTVTDEGSALGHDFDDTIAANVTIVPATCTTDGSKTVKCSRCDETQVTALTAGGHDTVHHDAKAATCTEIGWNAYDTCNNCSYTTYSEIPATGHNFTGTAKNNEDGTHSFKCVNTGCDVYGGTVPCSDFNVVVTAPTTETKGYTTHTCKVCGYFYVDSYTIKNEADETLNVDENQYIIRFVDEDGTLLQLLVVNKDDTPTYTKAAPTKTATAQYTYTHAGWTPTITAATEDATYTATFTGTVNKYNVKFVNWDGTELKSETLDYGAAITAPETNPTRANCDFAGWDNTVAATVTGDVTYKATFKLAGTENIVKDNEYVITFVNYNGTVLDSRIYAKDATVTAPTAERANCTFKAWTPAFSATAVADATYTATFTTEDKGGNTVDIGKNQYVIRFVNEGGALLQTKVVDKNATPSYTGATPTKAADVQYTYNFSSWDDTIVPATADKTYTATYTNTLNKYDVTVTGDEGVTVSANAKVDYGTVYTLTVTANEHYTKTAPTATVNGSALTLTKGEGNTYTANVTVDGTKTIAVTSTINSNTLTVTYKYENGTQASDTKTSTVDYNATYSVASETISGYVPVIETLKEGETINTSAATVEGVMPDSDVTVNVIYKVDANGNGTPDEDDAKLTVKYVAGANGAIKAGETTEIKVTYNGTYKTAWRPEVVAATDYMFSGWTNEPAEGAAITADVTITANFVEDRNHDGTADSEQASYTVKFVYNTEEKTASAKVLTGLTVPTAEVPDKATLNAVAPEGKCFKNWDNDPATTVITSDTTFTANYATDANGDGTPDDEETPWTVTYSYNGNTKTEKVLNNLYTKSVPTKETLNDAAPTGQCFKEWNADTSAKITADTTFIAVYATDKNNNDEPDETDTYYTVTYKYNGHTATESVLTGLTPANVPTKAVLNDAAPEHMCFKKWDKATNVAITANTEFNAEYAQDKNGDKNPDDEVALPEYDITVTAPANTTADSKNINVEYAAETKITLTAADGYNLPASVTVKVGGTELTSEQYSYVGGVVTINEYVIVSDVKDIVITGTATMVELSGTKAETTDANTTVKVTTDPVTVVGPTVVKVTAKDGYDLPETVVVKVNGKELATEKYNYNKKTGEITLTADVIESNNQTITVESTAAKTVVTGTKITDVENINETFVTDPVTIVDPTVINIKTVTGYEMPDEIVVKVDGVETKDYTYDKTTGNITLGENVITKNGQEITVESKNELVKTEIKTVNVDTSDDTITAEVTSKPVTVVDDTEITISTDKGHELPGTIKVVVDGKELVDSENPDEDEYDYDSETGKITIKADVITTENQKVEIIGNTTKKEVKGTTVTGGKNINATLATDPVTIVDPTVINIKTVTGYEMPDEIVVKVDGVETKDYTYDKTTGNITLGKDVIKDDNKTVTVESKNELVKTEIKTVNVDTSDDTIKAEVTSKPVTVVDDTEITISTDKGHELPGTIKVVVDGKELVDSENPDEDEYDYDSKTGKITIDADVITSEDQKVEIIGSTTEKQVTGTTVTTKDENTSVEIITDPVTVIGETKIKITPDEGYDIPKDIKVKVGEDEISDYTYDVTTGTITLGKDVITEDGKTITIESTATKTELKDVDITAEDKNITVTVDNINKLDDTEITLGTDKKYELPDNIKVVVDDKELANNQYSYDKETGKVKINKDVITKDGQKVEIKGTATRITVWGDWKSNGDGTMTRHSEEEGFEDLTQTVDCTNFTKKVIAPTCTDAGYTVYTCKDCGYTYNADETAAAGHKWGTWQIVEEATPETIGTASRECSVCQATETKTYEFNSDSRRTIKFITISKMHYQFIANSQEYAIYNNATINWYQNASLRFKIYAYTNTNVPYIYINGYTELKPDADGWYTIPASTENVVIFASAAKVDNSEEEEPTVVNPTNCTCLCHSQNAFLKFIWKIIAFFYKIFGINKTCACGKVHY